jgi:hypothetical protein
MNSGSLGVLFNNGNVLTSKKLDRFPLYSKHTKKTAISQLFAIFKAIFSA